MQPCLFPFSKYMMLVCLHLSSPYIFQVFDLKDVKPNDFVEYALGCLENLAALGDECAKEIRAKIKVMVC